MISPRDRQKAVELISESVQAGARAVEACKCLGIAFSSYLKWRQNPRSEDQRPKREFSPSGSFRKKSGRLCTSATASPMFAT